MCCLDTLHQNSQQVLLVSINHMSRCPLPAVMPLPWLLLLLLLLLLAIVNGAMREPAVAVAAVGDDRAAPALPLPVPAAPQIFWDPGLVGNAECRGSAHTSHLPMQGCLQSSVATTARTLSCTVAQTSACVAVRNNPDTQGDGQQAMAPDLGSYESATYMLRPAS